MEARERIKRKCLNGWTSLEIEVGGDLNMGGSSSEKESLKRLEYLHALSAPPKPKLFAYSLMLPLARIILVYLVEKIPYSDSGAGVSLMTTLLAAFCLIAWRFSLVFKRKPSVLEMKKLSIYLIIFGTMPTWLTQITLLLDYIGGVKNVFQKNEFIILFGFLMVNSIIIYFCVKFILPKMFKYFLRKTHGYEP